MPRPLLTALVAVIALAAWAGIAARGQTDDFANLPAAPALVDGDSLEHSTAEFATGEPRHTARASRSGQRPLPAFAAADDLELALPSPNVDRIGFAEAGRGTAKTLVPLGTLVDNANEDKFVPGDDIEGPDYHVLASQGAPWSATSSASVVVPRRAPLYAPVDGEVAEVARYPMADGASDVRVRIVPDAAPEVAVELRHVDDVGVRPGEQVEAGRTPLGVVRSISLAHPADAITKDDQAHLRVEVRPARSPGAPDPNAPAEPAPGT